MLRSDAENTVRNWDEFDKRIFKWVREFVPNDFMVLKKKKAVDWEGKEKIEYEIDLTNSTAKMKDLDHEELIKKMVSEELIYVQAYSSWVSPLNLKTGGCICSSWILNDNKYLHESFCPKYVDPFKV
jgi:hypothetical protein